MTMNLCSCGAPLTTDHTCQPLAIPSTVVTPVAPPIGSLCCPYCGQRTDTTGHSCTVAQRPQPKYPSPEEQLALGGALQPFGLAMVVAQGDAWGLTVFLLWRGRIVGRVQRFEMVADVMGVLAGDGTLANAKASMVVTRIKPDLGGTPESVAEQERVLTELKQNYPWLSITMQEPR